MIRPSFVEIRVDSPDHLTPLNPDAIMDVDPDTPSRRGPEPRRSDLMKTYMCVICGLIYDEAEGWPDDDIPPGTRWEDVPLNWKCPECGAGKDDFEMVEV